MLKISAKSRYAMETVLYLAAHAAPGEYVSLKEIAVSRQLSELYLEQICVRLKSAGLVESARGQRGGYRLSRAPDRTTAADVLEAMDESLAPVSCAKTPSSGMPACRRAPFCRIQPLWRVLLHAMSEVAASVTIKDLVQALKTGEAGRTAAAGTGGGGI